MKVRDWLKWYFNNDEIVKYSKDAVPLVWCVKDGVHDIRMVKCYLQINDKYGRHYGKVLVLYIGGRVRLKWIDENSCRFLTEDDFLGCECWDGYIF